MADDRPADPTCTNCGAPPSAEARGLPADLFCEYCDAPRVADPREHATPCWGCETWNVWEAEACAKCSANLQVACLHCEGRTPHHRGSCIHCGQLF